MKCKNCGASYSSRELCCPYCDTPNPRGVLWYHQRTEAMSDYERGLALLPLLRRVAINRILNRVLIAEIVCFALLIAGVFAFFAVDELSTTVSVQLRKPAVMEELDTLYQQQRYGELYSRLQEADLMGEAHYEYTQMALLYYDYERFTQQRMDYFSQMDQGELDDYILESLIRSIHDILNPYIPAYSEMTDSNREQMEVYEDDARAFARSVLGLTETEMKLFEEDYLTTEDTALLVKAAERGMQR